jgi:hypothetical protein
MEMSPKDALAVSVSDMEYMRRHVVKDKGEWDRRVSAAATLARLAPFVEAAMRHVQLMRDAEDEPSLFAEADRSWDALMEAHRALVGAPAPTEDATDWIDDEPSGGPAK